MLLITTMRLGIIESYRYICPRNEMVDSMNVRVQIMFPGDTVAGFSVDSLAFSTSKLIPNSVYELFDTPCTAAIQTQH